MSTYGVRTRFVSLCADSGGAVSAAAFAALADYAAERGYTPGELRALLRPASYLEASRVLRARGVGLADVRLDAGAWAAATALAARFAIAPIFDRLPNAQPQAAAPPAPSPARTEAPMFLGTEEAAGPPHALALRHVQAAVGAGHHLLDLAAGLGPRRLRRARLRRCRRLVPPAQGAPDVEQTDQEEDEQGDIAHGRGSRDGRRV